MNNVIVVGRLTKDVELRYTQGGSSVARFSIAVNRPYAKKEDEVTADFFNVVVWGKIGEACATHLKKGLQVALQGRLQNNNYTDKNGNKQYSVEIIAEQVQFIQWADKKPNGMSDNDYRAMNDDEVPF